jgi:tRNA dimethylallyltransferase
LSKKLIVIQGPTASGKTALSIALAKHFNTVIVSADSRQFYKEMEIGTAKPNLQEQEGIKHYFIDSHHVNEPLSAAKYEKEALSVLENEFKTHNIIILVGGSGMFIDALCYGLDLIPHDETLRNELTLLVKNNGLSTLLEELKEKDPIYYNEVDKKNPVRIIRAIEAIRISGKTYTEMRKKTVQKRTFEIIKFVIDLPRKILYDTINQRVDEMIKNELINEVKSLVQHKNLQTLNTVGYAELFEYLDGKYTLNEAVELIKQNTRRYAKRQVTWFRKDKDALWLKAKKTDDLKKEILKQM